MRILNNLTLMFVLFILGCSNGNSPENIAVEYTKAYHQCDFTKAMSFCSPKMRQTMQKEADFFMQQQLEKGVGKVNPRVSIIESEISKDGMKADVKLALGKSAIIEIGEGKTIEILIKLIKKDSVWYIGTE